MTKRYAARSKDKRVTVSWVVPVRISNYVRTISKHTGQSQSAIASEILEAAINGEPAKTITTESTLAS